MEHKVSLPPNVESIPITETVTAMRVVRCSDGRRFQARQTFCGPNLTAFEIAVGPKTSYRKAAAIAQGFHIHVEPANESVGDATAEESDTFIRAQGLPHE